MISKLVFILAFVALVIPQLGHADDGQNLPSRKASAVIPLLEKFSPQDLSEKTVSDQLTKILGESEGVALADAGSVQIHYELDDKTRILVVYSDGKLVTISILAPSQSWKVLFPPPKTE